MVDNKSFEHDNKAPPGPNIGLSQQERDLIGRSTFSLSVYQFIKIVINPW